MSNIITYSQCPVCRSNHISYILDVEDYTVSHEIFPIWHCYNCSCRFTQQIPDINGIGRYYQSDTYISHSDTKQGLVNRLYHTVRNYTLKAKRRLIEKQSGKKKGILLDVGAGTGAFANEMHEEGWKVIGLEPDKTAKENALKNYSLQLGDMNAIFSFKPETVDVITMWHVLEHVHQLHEYIDAFQQILKKDGTLIIAVPNYTSYDAKKYDIHWAAYDVPRHLYHFSPKALNALVKQHGFTIAGYKPMWFDSFYVSMLSEQYKTGKNNLLSAFWNGLRSNIRTMNNVKRCSSVIYIIKKS
ncbi:class I SAM-dependent methyltransferase [Panacibacter ginsenosidivorans]|uniref:Class I SAM-dependent methyltransferase n=1 Tax=Panacibacter ginsenosidivorans TaxID=1813871 RepID=A0A5B8VF35_9BACT|nr:class I SAM-dependent methyltransferase [Panacibacter ginsenosidivorans]QEC69631.1 class I SAM-dependent methyltransferase [Panacibacter ginsenosidivorans]